METIGPFIAQRGEDATLHSRQYGARDAETGWPAITYTDSTIKVMLKPMSSTVRDHPVGRVVDTRSRLYTLTAIENRDELTWRSVRWEIEDVQQDHAVLGLTGYYHFTLIRIRDA